MNRAYLAWVLALALAGVASGQQKRLGTIEFYGYEGLDIAAVKTALPFHEGDQFPAADTEWKQAARAAVKKVTGKEATDVAAVCCDTGGNWMLYIGLAGASAGQVAFNPAPTGENRFPAKFVTLYDEMEAAWKVAVVEKGNTGEDVSNGYSLAYEPNLKAKQMAIREYAVRNEKTILKVLEGSGDAHQRAMAATALGYARPSDDQIAALVTASFDSDSEVRNDAVRALGVILMVRTEAGRRIPADRFIDLLRSGSWSDRNKAGRLLASLTSTRDAKLLTQIREKALPALIEMTRWQNTGHAADFRMVLGRIAGIDEERLRKLTWTGQVDALLEELKASTRPR